MTWLLVGMMIMASSISTFDMVHAKTQKQVSVEQVLDGFHLAASKADGKTYFDFFAPNGVFIGTDATERWTVDEFRKYAEPYFSKGKGWTYLPVNRHVDYSSDKNVAWFDEILSNKSFGTCRGSGVLIKIGNQWKISQYHLTIPIPNELADEFAKQIQDKMKK